MRAPGRLRRQGRGSLTSTGHTHRTWLPAAASGPGTLLDLSGLRELSPTAGYFYVPGAFPSYDPHNQNHATGQARPNRAGRASALVKPRTWRPRPRPGSAPSPGQDREPLAPRRPGGPPAGCHLFRFPRPRESLTRAQLSPS